MKKLLILAAFAAMLLPLSCTKNNGENTDNGTVKMDAPATKEAAVKIEFDQSNPPKYEDNEHTFDILSLELTESQLYFLTRKITGVKVKAGVGDTETIWGLFSQAANGGYLIDILGTIKIDKSTKTVTISGTSFSYEGKVKELIFSNSNESTAAFNMHRKWKVDGSLLKVTGLELPIERGFNGCNLEEMAKYLADNGLSKLKGKLDEFQGLNVKYVSFTQAGTFEICFSGTPVSYDGKFTLSSDGKSISYDFSKYTNSFFNGKASGTIAFPAKGKMNVSLSVTIEGYSSTLELTMSEAM